MIENNIQSCRSSMPKNNERHINCKSRGSVLRMLLVLLVLLSALSVAAQMNVYQPTDGATVSHDINFVVKWGDNTGLGLQFSESDDFSEIVYSTQYFTDIDGWAQFAVPVSVFNNGTIYWRGVHYGVPSAVHSFVVDKDMAAAVDDRFDYGFASDGSGRSFTLSPQGTFATNFPDVLFHTPSNMAKKGDWLYFLKGRNSATTLGNYVAKIIAVNTATGIIYENDIDLSGLSTVNKNKNFAGVFRPLFYIDTDTQGNLYVASFGGRLAKAGSNNTYTYYSCLILPLDDTNPSCPVLTNKVYELPTNSTDLDYGPALLIKHYTVVGDISQLNFDVYSISSAMSQNGEVLEPVSFHWTVRPRTATTATITLASAMAVEGDIAWMYNGRMIPVGNDRFLVNSSSSNRLWLCSFDDYWGLRKLSSLQKCEITEGDLRITPEGTLSTNPDYRAYGIGAAYAEVGNTPLVIITKQVRERTIMEMYACPDLHNDDLTTAVPLWEMPHIGNETGFNEGYNRNAGGAAQWDASSIVIAPIETAPQSVKARRVQSSGDATAADIYLYGQGQSVAHYTVRRSIFTSAQSVDCAADSWAQRGNTLTNSGLSGGEVTIYNISGAAILTLRADACGTITIPTTLTPGIYIVSSAIQGSTPYKLAIH